MYLVLFLEPITFLEYIPMEYNLQDDIQTYLNMVEIPLDIELQTQNIENIGDQLSYTDEISDFEIPEYFFDPLPNEFVQQFEYDHIEIDE
jgi:hypothetical protein